MTTLSIVVGIAAKSGKIELDKAEVLNFSI